MLIKRTLLALTALAAGLALSGCGAPSTSTSTAPAAPAAAITTPKGAATVVYRSALPLATVVSNLQAALHAAGWIVPQQFNVETHLAAAKVQVPPSYLLDVVPAQAAAAVVSADPAAGLAFPLRVYVYQEGSSTYASYIQPSSVLTRYKSGVPSLGTLAAALDQQLAKMVAKAAQGSPVKAAAGDTPGQVLETMAVASGMHTKQAVASLAAQVKSNKWGINNQHSLAALLGKAGDKVTTGYYVEAFNAKLAGQLMNSDLPAGIEIPLRFYFYRQGGKLYLSYLAPSSIFTRYHDQTVGKLSQKLNSIVGDMVMAMTTKANAAGAACTVGCG